MRSQTICLICADSVLGPIIHERSYELQKVRAAPMAQQSMVNRPIGHPDRVARDRGASFQSTRLRKQFPCAALHCVEGSQVELVYLCVKAAIRSFASRLMRKLP